MLFESAFLRMSSPSGGPRGSAALTGARLTGPLSGLSQEQLPTSSVFSGHADSAFTGSDSALSGSGPALSEFGSPGGAEQLSHELERESRRYRHPL